MAAKESPGAVFARHHVLQRPALHVHRPHGVFATRAPWRPNPIALTVVELLRRDGRRLFVRGVDRLDGTRFWTSSPVSRARLPSTCAAAGSPKPKLAGNSSDNHITETIHDQANDWQDRERKRCSRA